MRKIVLSIVFLISFITLAACNFADDNKDKENRNEVLVTDKHGERTFLTNPKKVAFMTLDVLDLIDSVGMSETSITSIALSFKASTSILSSYNRDDVVDLGNHVSVNYDNLDLFNPDLIILGNRTSSLFQELTEKYPESGIYDASHDIQIGKLVDTMSKNANFLETIFPSLDNKITNKVNEIKTQIDALKTKTSGKNLLFLMASGGEVTAYGDNSRFAMVYNDFGFSVADLNISTGNAHGQKISYEQIGEINPEVILLLDRDSAIGGESSNLNDIINNTIVKNTVAGTNNDIYGLDNESWYLLAGGYNAAKRMITDIEQFTK